MTQIAQSRPAGGAANAAARHQAAALQAKQASADAPQQYLTFLLGGEMFAVGILNVKEIIEYGNLTEIPMMPPFIRGVINLRGSVVPVVDLSARFGHAQSEVGKRSCIVIVEVSESDFRHDIGIMVDAVSEVIEIPPRCSGWICDSDGAEVRRSARQLPGAAAPRAASAGPESTCGRPRDARTTPGRALRRDSRPRSRATRPSTHSRAPRRPTTRARAASRRRPR